MKVIQCPKCHYDASNYQAPKGKVIRNPYADLSKAIFDDCNACGGTGHVPEAVVMSIVNFAMGGPVQSAASLNSKVDVYLASLRWSIDHFSFYVHGMYVGVEVDGYLHT